MSRKTMRALFDVLLTIMIVFEMLIQYTGDFLHEVIGFAFFATVVAHLVLSTKWMKSVTRSAKRGRLSARNGALAAMGIMLAGTMLVLGVSSLAISEILSSAGLAWTIGSYSTWATVHAASSYALCALVVVHLAMHWAFLASAFKVEYDPSRRHAINVGVHAVAAVGAVALGINAAKEVFPQVAQVALAEDADRKPFASLSDIPYEETSPSSGNASSSDRATAESTDTTNGKGGRRHGKGEKGQIAESSSTNPSEIADTANRPDTYSAPSEQEGQDTYESQGALDDNAYNYYEPDYETEESEQPSFSNVSGTCPLCHKNCPLSAPRCNKPYEAGLI